MRVLVTGATGLIGREIVALFQEKDIKISYLTTNKSKIVDTPNYKGFYWNPKTQKIDINCLLGVDTIVHLAGATISKRWTSRYKKEIVNSRVEGTNLLIDALKANKHQITQIISASAIGIYPDSLTNYYDQVNGEKSNSFLGEVVQAWEQSVNGFSKIGIQVAKIRIGIVLSKKGGALQEMVKPIKYGGGAAFGTGKQWQSWIHIHDLAHMFLFIYQNKLEGIYNGVAPNPVSNIELTKTIAEILKKPLFLPNIPKFVMKTILGDMHILLFESQRVASKPIEEKGFEFKFHHLQPALEDILL